MDIFNKLRVRFFLNNRACLGKKTPDKPPHAKRVNEDNSDEFISANSTDFKYDTTASYFHRNIQMT